MTIGFITEQGLELINQLGQWLEKVALQYGYVGIFFISILGAASIIIPIPYTIIIFSIGSLRILNPFFIAVSGGAGSAVGEFFGYILGYYGRTVISNEQKRKMNYILKLFTKYGAATIFLFALTPLPDDLLFIPLGIMRFNFLKAFIPSLLGKILMCFILAYGGHASINIIETFLGGEGGPLTIIASTILMVIVLVAMFKINWEKLLPLDDKDKKS